VNTSASALSGNDVVCWLRGRKMPCDAGGENARGGLDTWLLYSEALRVYVPSRCWESQR
jgi:hypothetical protein